MHSLESPHQPPEMWIKRQQLKSIMKERPMFEQLMRLTGKCMMKNPQFDSDVNGAIACETFHPSIEDSNSNFSFHTHPHSDIDYPSDVDKNTNNERNKDWLLIGLPSKNKVVAYHKSDGFTKKVAEF